MRPSILVFLIGCSVNEDNFGEHYASASCSFAKQCMAYSFYTAWDEKSDCYDDLLEEYDTFQEDVLDELDCEFDPDKAEDCLAAYGASCEDAADGNDIDQDCNEVWDCGGSNAGAGGMHFFD
jgi:hypothetical protein